MRSQPGDMVEFTFWVNIKFPEEADLSLLISPRVGEVQELPQGHTKDSLTPHRPRNVQVQQLVNKPVAFGALAKGIKLSIICADDVYYNLEALKIVFH